MPPEGNSSYVKSGVLRHLTGTAFWRCLCSFFYFLLKMDLEENNSGSDAER